MRALAVLFVVLSTPTLATAHATAGIEYASQVGVFMVQPNGPYEWEVRCDPTEPGAVVATAVVEARQYPEHDFFFTHFRHDHFHRDEGRLLQIADQQVVLEHGEPVAQRYTGLRFSGDLGLTVRTLYVAWAIWGTSATCTATFNDTPISFRTYPGSHAFYAGPEAFTGGTFVQDGRAHSSVARLLTHPLSGGPSFASIDSERFGASLFISDDSSAAASPCHQPFGGSCSWDSFDATVVTVAVPVSFGGSGGAQGEVWLMHLPPQDPLR